MEIIQEIIQAFKNATWLEYIGVLFSLLQAYFASQNKAYNYFFAFVATTITIYIFIKSNLFAQAVLNSYYLIMAVYGYLLWTQKTKDQVEKPIQWSQAKDAIFSGLITLGSFGLFYLLFTKEEYVLLDSMVAALGFGGMWLLAQRKMESWLLLNASNVIAIITLYQTKLYLYFGLTILLFVLGCVGFINWYKLMQQEKAAK